jgi:predicted  nucleic acid-binding Zn-ribbon protein
MSPIGRVFIVLNLVLAAVFLGMSGFYLQQATSWKEKHVDEVTARAKSEENLNSQIAKLSDSESTLKQNLARADEEKADLGRNLRNAEQENTDLKGRLTNVEKNLATINGSVSSVSTELASYNKQNQELRDKYLTAQAETQNATQAKDDAEARLSAAQQDIVRLTENNLAMQDENGRTRDEIARLSTIKLAYEERFPGLMVPAKAIDGTIVAVDANLKIATISVGSENGGVEAGVKFAVFDGGSYKGDILITDVTPQVSHGRIVVENPGKVINKGDQCSTRFTRFQ